jgi:hypothetical protein
MTISELRENRKSEGMKMHSKQSRERVDID